MRQEQPEKQPDFPGFDELKSLPDNATPYNFSVSLPEVSGQYRLLKMGGVAVSDGCMELRSQRLSVHMEHLNDLPMIEMNFSLEGNIRQKLGFLQEEVLYSKGYHNIMYNQGEWEHNQFLHCGTHNTFTINIHTERFLQLFYGHSSPMDELVEKVAKGTPFLVHRPPLTFTPQMGAIIQSFWNTPLTGGLKSLFMETKIMELMLLQWELFLQPTPCKAQYDLEKLELAKEILLKDMQHPPSLTKLARLCGLNEFKLKKGFKEVYHNTVFGYFAAARLEQARQLVLHTGKTLSEIAYETGFSHPQHFQRAFKQQFGTAPGQLRK